MKIAPEIKSYLDKLKNNDREVLLELREEIFDCLKMFKISDDRISEKISYGMPAVCVDTKACFGFAKFTNHFTFFPFSGNVLRDFQSELKKLGLTFTKSGVHFSESKRIPKSLLKEIIKARLNLD